MQLIDLHIPLRGPLRLGFQVLARLLSLDHEGGQDRTGCRRAPNAARRKRIQREEYLACARSFAQLGFGGKSWDSKLSNTQTLLVLLAD